MFWWKAIQNGTKFRLLEIFKKRLALMLFIVKIYTGIYPRGNESKFLCEANIVKNGVNGLTMERETPSCLGCKLRCGFRKEIVASIEDWTELTKQDLVAVVTKVYGVPLAVLGGVLLFESIVFSIDSIGLLFILLSILPASIVLMTRWAKGSISD